MLGGVKVLNEVEKVEQVKSGKESGKGDRAGILMGKCTFSDVRVSRIAQMLRTRVLIFCLCIPTGLQGGKFARSADGPRKLLPRSLSKKKSRELRAERLRAESAQNSENVKSTGCWEAWKY